MHNLHNTTLLTTTTVIVSFFGDQYFWGDRVTDLGVGKTIRIQNLTMENLCEALVAVSTDQVMQSKAAAIGKKLQSEDGVKTAIEDFHHYLPIATPRAF
jgi:sterol 3beta-glucosyltransferase